MLASSSIVAVRRASSACARPSQTVLPLSRELFHHTTAACATGYAHAQVQQPYPRDQAASWASFRAASCGNDLLPGSALAHQRPFSSSSSSSSSDRDDSNSDQGTTIGGEGHERGEQAEQSSSRVSRIAEMRAALRAELGRIDGHAADINIRINNNKGAADGPLGAADADASSASAGGGHGAYFTAAKKAGRLVDRVTVIAEAGGGGAGGLSFVSKYRIPDGGNGGTGGSVILRASENVRCLGGIRTLQKAKRGQQGGPQRRTGAPGETRVVEVPIGTEVSLLKASSQGLEEDEDDLDEEDHFSGEWGAPIRGDAESTELIADLVSHGEELVLAQGGEGGIGNAIASTTIRRPGNRAFARPVPEHLRARQPGKAGEAVRVMLEMKALADVGLVGMPNAGKSTLLKALSAARPEVGAYPFTTLQPQLGSVQYDDGSSTTVADIPGLIQGAHENRGLGHAFLRHIERTRVLVYVVDASQTGLGGGKGIEALPPAGQLQLLMDELREYDPELLERPSLVAANKMDLVAAAASRATGGDIADSTKEALLELRAGTEWPVVEVSGLTQAGVEDLVEVVRQLCPTDMDKKSV